jgi:riboflavin biosynthesis pyrimidine reductase
MLWGTPLSHGEDLLVDALTPLETLYELQDGSDLPLPPELETFYGHLRFPPHPGRPYVIGNLVTSLDGIVALDMVGRSGGGEISGFNQHDQMVMGLLRAIADAVIVGAGTQRAAPQHRWTAAYIYPALAGACQQLRIALGKAEPPLNVIVSARGMIDLDLPVFQAGEVPVLIVTTAAGRQRIAARALPSWVQLVALGDTGRLGARGILDAVSRVRQSEIILTEGGPQLLGDFLAGRCLDELFLTLAPQVVGRDGSAERPGLVMGKRFAPEQPLWGRLVGVKRGGSHLFLRYAFVGAGV